MTFFFWECFDYLLTNSKYRIYNIILVAVNFTNYDQARHLSIKDIVY